MKNLKILATGLFFIFILSGCGSSPVDMAKSLVFDGTTTSIEDLLNEHPDIIKSSINWIEDDSLGQKGIVVCRLLAHYAPKQFTYPGLGLAETEKDQYNVDLIFAVGDKSGRLLEIQAEDPVFVKKNLKSPDISEFLLALENKTSLMKALLSNTFFSFSESEN